MPPTGLFFYRKTLLRTEPEIKRTFAFFDGQNLFHHAKSAFGYSYPNFDPFLLASKICKQKNWNLEKIYFYTGIPDTTDNPFWNSFWNKKLQIMGTRKIETFSRPLKYRNQTVALPDGSSTVVPVGQEKGIDVRIALDIVRSALENKYDIALIFSQDQDLSEAIDDVKKISELQNRWVKTACAFPVSPVIKKPRGINKTDWIPIDREMYNSCIDSNDYRPKR